MSARPWRRLPRPAEAGRRWLVGAAALVVAVATALGVGQAASHQLTVARYGVLEGTSRVGEWADLSRYGLRVRLDEVAVAEGFPDRYQPQKQQRALDGMLLVRVRMTVEPTIDIARDNVQDMVSCDIALWTRTGARILPSGPPLAGPTGDSCATIRPVVKGTATQLQQVFQVLPEDAEGLVVQVTSSETRPRAGGTWPVWDFVPG